jgi:hypothetical protein
MKKLLILIFLFSTGLKSYSCDCSERPSIKVSWESANEVFTGKIIKVDTLLYGNNGAKIHSYTIELIKSFKQDFYNDREFRTVLSQSGASCDFMFELGKVYLIYAKTESQTLACSICSRTNLIQNIGDDEIKTLQNLYKIYTSDTSGVRTIKLESNTSYQIDLVKNSFEEKLKSKDQIIYILSSGIILLIIMTIIIAKRKSSR